MQKIKATELFKLPYEQWPKDGYPKTYEEIIDPENYATTLFEFTSEQLAAITNYYSSSSEQQVRDIEEFWRHAISKCDPKLYYIDLGGVYKLPSTEEEKTEALQKAQEQYFQDRESLHAAITNCVPSLPNFDIWACYYVQYSVEWNL